MPGREGDALRLRALNNAGEMVGSEYPTTHNPQNEWPVHITKGGTLTRLPLPQNFNGGDAADINDVGRIVGTVIGIGELYPAHAFAADSPAGPVVPLADLGGERRATAVNRAGTIAGSVQVPALDPINPPFHASIWATRGEVFDLSYLGVKSQSCWKKLPGRAARLGCDAA